MAVVFKNNATTTLNGSITNVATSITVTSGAVFPTVTARVNPTAPTNGSEGIFENQKLMIHADVTNGSTTFTDITGKTITNNGNNFTGNTTTFKYGTASASNATNSTAPSLYTAHADFAVGTGDLHFSGWFYRDAGGNNIQQWATLFRTSTVYASLFSIGNAGTRLYYNNGGGNTFTDGSEGSFTNSTWYYMAVERYNGLWYVYRDNTRVINALDATTRNPNYSASSTMAFGGDAAATDLLTNSLVGKMDELTFFNKSLYQGAATITAPTSQLVYYPNPVQSSSTNSTTAGDYFYATITDGTNREVVKVTAVSGNTLTVTRGQDGTSGTAFASGSTIEIRPTNQGLIDLGDDRFYRDVATRSKRYLGA